MHYSSHGCFYLTHSVDAFAMLCICREFMEVQCFEIKTEADSNDITLCSDDDKPSTGMFSVSLTIKENRLRWFGLVDRKDDTDRSIVV